MSRIHRARRARVTAALAATLTTGLLLTACSGTTEAPAPLPTATDAPVNVTGDGDTTANGAPEDTSSDDAASGSENGADNATESETAGQILSPEEAYEQRAQTQPAHPNPMGDKFFYFKFDPVPAPTQGTLEAREYAAVIQQIIRGPILGTDTDIAKQTFQQSSPKVANFLRDYYELDQDTWDTPLGTAFYYFVSTNDFSTHPENPYLDEVSTKVALNGDVLSVDKTYRGEDENDDLVHRRITGTFTLNTSGEKPVLVDMDLQTTDLRPEAQR